MSKLIAEQAIRMVKNTFLYKLCDELNLSVVSAPVVVLKGTGINDDLNGVERAVGFPIKDMGEQRAEVVHSLAKWKRLRLKEYGIEEGNGIVTDMRALRPDEEMSKIHSISVDQFDWEKHISEKDRNLNTLKDTVNKIYNAIKYTYQISLINGWTEDSLSLPNDITFVHTEELIKEFPNLTPKQRENAIVQRYGSVFLIGIGGELSNGVKHDGRAPDYDDWSTPTEEGLKGLNGDILIWNPALGTSFEISSMGIRVDKTALLRQLEIEGCLDRKNLYFHNELLEGRLPQSIGGGIGQSRLAMLILQKKHIGEVQVSIWSDDVIESAKEMGIELL
jgi:aspartate--ammonia ligase